MTLPSWSSMLTGCNPGRHGIYDFVRRKPGTWDLEFTNATHRQVPTVHRVLSDRGARVASIAVPTTWPPDDLNGVVVSGFDSPVSTGIDGSFCHPPELYAQLQRRFGGLRFADFQETDIGAGWHEDALGALLREIPRKEGIGRWLLGQERWDLFMLLFGESDTVSHHFWMFMDERSRATPSGGSGGPPRGPAGGHRDGLRAPRPGRGRLIEQAQPEDLPVLGPWLGGAAPRVVPQPLPGAGGLAVLPAAGAGRGVRTGSVLDRLKEQAVKRLPAAARPASLPARPPRGAGGAAAATATRQGGDPRGLR